MDKLTDIFMNIYTNWTTLHWLGFCVGIQILSAAYCLYCAIRCGGRSAWEGSDAMYYNVVMSVTPMIVIGLIALDIIFMLISKAQGLW